MKVSDLIKSIRVFTGEKSTQNTWDDNTDMITIIQMGLNELSLYNVLTADGYTTTITEDTEENISIPSDIFKLSSIRIGDYPYLPIREDDRDYIWSYLGDHYKFVVNESDWTISFYEMPSVDSVINWHGFRTHVNITSLEDEIEFDKRFDNALIYYCVSLALAKVEDQNAYWENKFMREMASLGFNFKDPIRVNYYTTKKKYMQNYGR